LTRITHKSDGKFSNGNQVFSHKGLILND